MPLNEKGTHLHSGEWGQDSRLYETMSWSCMTCGVLNSITTDQCVVCWKPKGTKYEKMNLTIDEKDPINSSFIQSSHWNEENSVSSESEEKIYECCFEECGEHLTDAKEFKAHIAQHKWGPHKASLDAKGNSSFHCLYEGCNKILHDRKLLKKHLLTHREKLFVCHYEDCDKKFYERAKLKRHFLVHTGEKPFQCPYDNCGKQFGYKANLKTHLRTHTGLRPFKCSFEGCERRFAQASNRNSHVLTHQKNSKISTPTKTDHSISNNLSVPMNLCTNDGVQINISQFQLDPDDIDLRSVIQLTENEAKVASHVPYFLSAPDIFAIQPQGLDLAQFYGFLDDQHSNFQKNYTEIGNFQHINVILEN